MDEQAPRNFCGAMTGGGLTVQPLASTLPMELGILRCRPTGLPILI